MPDKVRKDQLHLRDDRQQLSLRMATISMRADGPSSFDREARTVDVVMTTEDPVPVYDYDLGGVVPEILLMSGLKLPKARQVPLQDAHDRWTIKATLGSVRNMRTENDKAVGTVHFSRVPDAEEAMIKVEEQHLTDFSVGWMPHKVTRLRADEKKTIGGREFAGPLRVVTSWTIKELSIVPVGADPNAKARAEEHTEKKESTMDEKLRAELIRLGMKADATDEEALAFLRGIEKTRAAGSAAAPGAENAPPAPAGDSAQGVRAEAGQIVEVVREAYAKEVSRVRSIEAMCSRHGVAKEIETELVAKGRTIEEASRAILEHLEKTDPVKGVGMPAGQIAFGADAADKFRSAVVYSLVIDRAGISMKDLPEAPGHNDFRGFTLREIARECLRAAGRPTGGNVVEMVGRALTTSDLPYILADVANKSLQAGFALHEETYEAWTDTVPVNDFKAMNLVSVSSLDDLLAISEHGEYRYGYFTDKKETVTLGTAGRIYPVTRTALINDDLNAIATVFLGAGQKARKYEGDLVYALLTSNPTMNEDSHPLFDTTGGTAYHGNQGTAGVPDVDTLNEFDKLLGAMTGINGEMINIPLRFVIAPRAIRGISEAFFKTLQFLTVDNLKMDNPWYGDAVQRVYERRLDASSAKIWYGAGPKGTTVVRAHLSGVQTPYTEQRTGWTVDGVELKVRYDVAAGLRDWRSLLRNPGR